MIPIVLSFGEPLRIGTVGQSSLARSPGSFVAGLHPCPVEIASDGGAEFVQIDLTLLGACRVLGTSLKDMASHVLSFADALDSSWRELNERLAELSSWEERLALAETFALGKAIAAPRTEVSYATGALFQSSGRVRIQDVAQEIGFSRKHLSAVFSNSFGLPPKTLARMIRFRHACRLAGVGVVKDWSAVAYAAGFADQAHLAREFLALAGEPPTAWAARLRRINHEFLRPW